MEAAEVDASKSGGLGKKMKNISLTMRKKMGRKYTKALSEEMVSACLTVQQPLQQNVPAVLLHF